LELLEIADQDQRASAAGIPKAGDILFLSYKTGFHGRKQAGPDAQTVKNPSRPR